MKEGVIPHTNKPRHIHHRAIVTKETVDRQVTPQNQLSFLHLMAILLLPEEIIGTKYPDYYSPPLELFQSIFSFDEEN